MTATAKVLLVDDDDRVLQGLARNLRGRFGVLTANSGDQALKMAEIDADIAVIVADMRMPGMTGIELLTNMMTSSPDTVRLMLTGDTDLDTAARAINEGNIFKFLTKPCSPDVLVGAISEGVEEYGKIVRQRELEQELRDFAYTDELTKVNNRRRFLELAQVELKRARRFGHPLSIGMIDLDELKQINDEWGHAAGDEVIAGVAQIAVNAVRDVDIFGRYGGDEFVVLLVETNLQGAMTAADRVRTRVAAHEFAVDDHTLTTSVSIGLAALGVGESLGDVLERADKALYFAKVNGRNRTEPLGRQMAN